MSSHSSPVSFTSFSNLSLTTPPIHWTMALFTCRFTSWTAAKHATRWFRLGFPQSQWMKLWHDHPPQKKGSKWRKIQQSVSQSNGVSFGVLAGSHLKTDTSLDRVFDLLLIPWIICFCIGHIDFTEGSGHLGNAFISKRNLLGQGGTCFLGFAIMQGCKKNKALTVTSSN